MTQRDRDRRLTTLWNQGYLVSVIAQRMGFNHGSSVSHAAKRLGLPRRRRPTNTSAATIASRLARQVRGEQAQLARLEQAEKRDHGPQPQRWRCEICAGVCLTGPVHATHGEEA